ncbi:O-antigen ligase family protein [Virgibacillus halodenitrificans]|uniref:O-antigen ligase family protein n=1 Tax=Virgibacillus halodenitrificans TaxID=1482 RepID=UPI00045D349C|nr:O-antigen ligase family protein [Virgibacillus halodenitrificans]MEC2158238.1 O-antigen ligase family protein [Virgibacillus halodenitrificans]CDQ31139.1 hypothetical protein BN993_00511 [Virgibacillus halodenitrificans]
MNNQFFYIGPILIFLVFMLAMFIINSSISMIGYVLGVATLIISLILVANQRLSRKHFSGVFLGLILILGLIILMVKTQDFPVVTKKQIHAATDHLENNNDILQAVIEVEEETISCSMKVKHNSSEEEKEELGESCAKVLAKEVSKNSALTKPTANYLGELYDFYSLELMVGTDHEEDEIMFMRKNKDTKELVW